MSLRKLFFVLVFFIPIPVYAYQVYKVVTPFPYRSCSCETATIFKIDDLHYMAHRCGGSYLTRRINVESFDVEAQTFQIRVGFSRYEVVILEHESKREDSARPQSRCVR